jgi:hypothetical protein
MGVKQSVYHKGRKHIVFVNRVLRRIFEPKREEVRVNWRKLHNEMLQNIYLHQIVLG